MIFTDNFTPEELAILSNVIAIELCKDRTANEISVISSFLSAVGDIMAIIAAQREQLESLQEESSASQPEGNKKKEG